MIYCPKCRTKNDYNAAYCTKCGISLKSDTTYNIERHAKKFASDMEQMGKKVGETMAQTAKRMENRFDQAGRYAENWYDHRFGVIGPLISSFIFLIILRLIILIIQIPSNATQESIAISSVLLFYILPLFTITLISNYTKYFAKKSYQFKIFSPLFYSIALVLFLWVVVNILRDIGSKLKIIDLNTAAASLESSLPTIFIIVLFVGYIMLAVTIPRETEKKS